MKGPWYSLWFILLVVLLSFWAASVWVIPLYLGIAWILLLFIALMLLLITALGSPAASKRSKFRNKLANPHFVNEKVGFRFTTILWLLIFFLTAAIITGYVV